MPLGLSRWRVGNTGLILVGGDLESGIRFRWSTRGTRGYQTRECARIIKGCGRARNSSVVALRQSECRGEVADFLSPPLDLPSLFHRDKTEIFLHGDSRTPRPSYFALTPQITAPKPADGLFQFSRTISIAIHRILLSNIMSNGARSTGRCDNNPSSVH